MAYRPPIVPPKRSQSRRAREAAQSAVRRRELAKALRVRLLELIAASAAASSGPIRPPEPPFRGEPIRPPQPPFRGMPHLPPEGFFPPPGRGEPLFDPQTPRPPSIADWVRQPGFFAEEPSGDPRFF